jgi:hypothetical protein
VGVFTMPKLANNSWNLLSLIDSEGGLNSCWPFLGHTNLNGYGQIRRGKRKSVKAHRWAYEHFYNTELSDLFVLHSCDNKKCCNPLHLKLGTHKENMAEVKERGLSKKLCYKTIKELREKGLTQKEIATKMQCAPNTIWQILKSFR